MSQKTHFEYFLDDLESLITQYREAVESEGHGRFISAVRNLRFTAKRNVRPTLKDKFDQILGAVSRQFEIRESTIKSRLRTEDVCAARQVCHFLARKMTDASYPEIGAYFERNHGTIMHNEMVVVDRMKTYPEFSLKVVAARNAVQEIEKQSLAASAEAVR